MPRSGLTRAAVIAAATQLIDAEGLPALTLQRLATALGIRSSSLFNHVAGLPDLRRELQLHGQRELSERVARAAVGRAGGEAVVAAAVAMRGFAQEHPGLYAASLPATWPDDPELRAAAEQFNAIFFDTIRHYGFSALDATHAVRGLYSLVHGFIVLEQAQRFSLPVDIDASFVWVVRRYIAALEEQRGPPRDDEEAGTKQG